MLNSFERLVGWRFTRGARGTEVGGRRDGFISFIAVLAIVGIAVGVAALIVVMSVVNGFEREVRDRMLKVVSHVELISTAGADGWQALAQQARADERVIGAAPFVAGEAVAAHDEAMRGTIVRGIDPASEPQVSDVGGAMTAGELTALEPGSKAVVLGAALARTLRVAVGSQIGLITPASASSPESSATLLPNAGRFRVAGLFETGHYEYDSGLILMNWEDARTYFGGRSLSGVRLRLSTPDAAPTVSYALSQRLGPGVVVRDWSSENRIWFASVQVQKRMLAVILALIIGVAAFNLVAMLVMVVTDKRSDIAILRTLGASQQSILAIFMIQGVIIGLIGTLVGAALGLLVAVNVGRIVHTIERIVGTKVLDPAVYLLSELPSRVHPAEVLAIAVGSMVLALVATIYPSLHAASVRPAEALRHE